MHIMIETNYNERIITRDLDQKELAALLDAFRGARIYTHNYGDEKFTKKDENLELKVIDNTDTRLEKNFRDHVMTAVANSDIQGG